MPTPASSRPPADHQVPPDQAQPPASPPPPAPKKGWYVFSNGKMQIFEDAPDKYDHAQDLFRKVVGSQQASLENVRSFSLSGDATEGGRVSIITRDGEMHSQPMTQDIAQSLPYLMGATSTPPADQPTSSDSDQQEQQPQDDSSPPTQSPSQPGQPSGPSQQPGSSQPSASPAQPPVAPQQSQDLLDRLNRIEQALQRQAAPPLPQQPVYIPYPIGAPALQGPIPAPPGIVPPAPGVNNTATQGFLTGYLSDELPQLRKISEQIIGRDHDELDTYITRIQTQSQDRAHNRPLTYSSGELEQFQTGVQRIVYEHLRTQMQGLNQVPQLQQHLQNPPNLPDGQQQLLTHLLTPAAAALTPHPALDILLKVELAIANRSKQFLLQNIDRIEQNLQQRLQINLPANLVALRTELQQPTSPTLQRIGTINQSTIQFFKEALEAQINRITTQIEPLQAPFQVANQIPIPANATLNDLLQISQNLRPRFHTYLTQQIARIPAQARPQIDVNQSLDELLNIPGQIIDNYKQRLKQQIDRLPEALRPRIAIAADANLPQLLLIQPQIDPAFNQYIREKIAEIQGMALDGDDQAELQRILHRLMPAGRRTLAQLITSLQAAPAPDRRRLFQVHGLIQEFIEYKAAKQHRAAQRQTATRITKITIGALMAVALLYIVCTKFASGSSPTMGFSDSETCLAGQNIVSKLAGRFFT